jgi:hypothetical protein
MRQFTRSEAEAALPVLAPLLEELQRKVEEFRLHPNDALEDAIRVLLEKIIGSGVDLKDPRQGLIDFPTRRDGRPAYLCWKLGEGPRVLFWHDVDAGFAGRSAIDRLN